MVALTLRATKGAPLTHQEVDDNFTNLEAATIPAGGAAGEVLAKASGTDYDTEWIAAGGGSTRELLTANRTYYVRSDGSDSNNGLANTAGGAFLTLDYAYGVIASTLDFGGYTVTLQIADGTYSGLSVLYQSSPVTNGPLYIRGNITTPANVEITGGISILALSGANFVCISGVTVPYINVNYNNYVWLGSDPAYAETGAIRYTSTTECIYLYYGARMEIYGVHTIDDTAINKFIDMGYNATISYADFDVVCPSPVTVSTAFLSVDEGSRAVGFGTVGVTGTVTGPRVRATKASVVSGNTGNQTFVPGNSDGTIDATSVLA